ncbi:unnamed protein product [Bursaphelenchus xylophilus]|uniref:(pine wood nematode) hypothetical protein n=1 Tax=Bursaphelenchus xylophilus TaxID=6326 RepID=A0A1I7SW40_BURXY|nr:unnamed protein product [Bursaphelenchus xylophilus]CAG9098769.1 unnamed protein product [Bursaphelenchus xylophilus]
MTREKSSFLDGLVGVSGASSTSSMDSPTNSSITDLSTDEDDFLDLEEAQRMLDEAKKRRFKQEMGPGSADSSEKMGSGWLAALWDGSRFWMCGLGGAEPTSLAIVEAAHPPPMSGGWPSSTALTAPRQEQSSADWLSDQQRLLRAWRAREKKKLETTGVDLGSRRSTAPTPSRGPQPHWKPLPLACTATSATMADAVTEALEQLTADQIEQFRKYFNMFDKEQKGFIRANQVGQILRTMGQAFEDRDLKQLIKEFDSDGSGEIEFEEFAAMVANFVVSAEDNDGLEEELREAFRLYDKEGNGYINVSDLREILRALDDNVSEEELDEMIAEIDTDGSGTVDFDEFMEMMSGE